MNTSFFARRGARILTGAVLGTTLAIAIPLAASAHVSVTPDDAPAGATSRLSFGFSHGCDGSPTTALVVTIPAGVGNTKPVVDASWQISRVLGANGTPTEVTYTAVTPIESGLAAAVSMDVLFDTAAAESTLAFPVTQQCVTGSTSWSEVAEPGLDPETLKHPAPVVAVGAVDASGEHGHAAQPTASPAPEAASAESAIDPVARALAIGGLAAGVTGIAVGVVLALTRRTPRP